MIIDIVKHKNNLISVSNFNKISEKILNGYFLPKNDSDLIWKISDDCISDVWIQFFCDDFINFKEIIFDCNYYITEDFNENELLKNTYIIYEYSLDGYNWFEFQYKKYDNFYYKKLFNYTLNDLEYVVYMKAQDFKDLRTYNENFIIDSKNNSDKTDIEYVILKGKYIFSNPTNTEYIYDIRCKYIRIRIKNLTVPLINSNYEDFYLKDFKIYSDEYIEIKEPLVVLKNDELFRPSFFDYQNFIPDICKSYFEMLEYNDNNEKNRYQNIKRNSRMMIQ